MKELRAVKDLRAMKDVRKGNGRGRLMLLGLAVGAGALFVLELPEIRRYWKMLTM